MFIQYSVSLSGRAKARVRREEGEKKERRNGRREGGREAEETETVGRQIFTVPWIQKSPDMAKFSCLRQLGSSFPEMETITLSINLRLPISLSRRSQDSLDEEHTSCSRCCQASPSLTESRWNMDPGAPAGNVGSALSPGHLGDTASWLSGENSHLTDGKLVSLFLVNLLPTVSAWVQLPFLCLTQSLLK